MQWLSAFSFALLHMQDVMAVLAPVSLLLFVVARWRHLSMPHGLPGEAVLLLLFLSFVMLMVVVQDSKANLSWIEFLRAHAKILYSSMIFFAFFSFRPTARIEEQVYPALVYTAGAVAVLTLYSNFVAPVSIGDTVIESGNLLRGPLGGHNVTAGSLGLALVIGLPRLTGLEGHGALRPSGPGWLFWTAFAAAGVTFVLAQSRGFTAGILAVAGLLVGRVLLQDVTRGRLTARTFRTLTAAAVALLGAALALSGRIADIENDPNVLTRFELWSRAFDMFAESPLVGLGLGTFQQVDVRSDALVPGLLALRTGGYYPADITHHDAEGGQHAHNLYLQLLAETGMVGFVLFALVFAVSLASYVPRPRPGLAQPATPEAIPERARLNRDLILTLLIYLAFAGVAAGQTLLSPTLAWPLYAAMGRLARQRMAMA